jgi:hypothetical protein
MTGLLISYREDTLRNVKWVFLIVLALAISLVMAACGTSDFEPQGDPATAAPTATTGGGTTGSTEPANLVVASDQTIAADNLVRIDRVKLAQAGYVVIRTNNNGVPGDTVVGYNRFDAGDNTNVSFTIDSTLLAAGANALWAVLHTDAGTASIFEFPGADVPLTNTDGTPVADQFTATK